MGVAILFGALGVWLAEKCKENIHIFTTAIFGAFMIVRGIGMYLPGYPA